MGRYAEMRWVLILFILILKQEAFAASIYAGTKRLHKTVSAAVQAASAGDTVYVDSGHYREKTLLIDKSIVLIGSGLPVLDGESKYQIISVTADRVTIQGFKLIHSGISSMDDLSGIKIYDSDHVIIRNNILEDTFFGIYIQDGKYCLIENNILTGQSETEQRSGNGIHCWKGSNLRIRGNTITGHRDGIYFEFVKNSFIRKNNASDNLRYGLHFMFSNDDTYAQNVFRRNGSGVSVMYSNRIKMFHNRFEENWGDAAYGLLLKEITDSYVQGNEFRKRTGGTQRTGSY